MEIGIVSTYVEFSKILGFLSIFIIIIGIIIESMFILIDFGIWLIEKAKICVKIGKIKKITVD